MCNIQITVKRLIISSQDTGEEKDMYLKSEDIMVTGVSNIYCLKNLFLILFFQNTKAICLIRLFYFG